MALFEVTPFAAELRRAMAARGMTPQQVIHATGIGRSAIYMYLRGHRHPQGSFLDRLERALDTPLPSVKRKYRPVAPRSVDPELGPMRYCRRCEEWWPEDAEFFVKSGQRLAGCRACHYEGVRRRSEKRRIE